MTDTTNPVADLPQITEQADGGAEVEAPEPQEGEEQLPAEPEVEDLEFEGHKLKLPKDAAEAIRKGALMQKDYTQKTQAAAEERRMIEAQKAEIAARVQSATAHIEDVAELHVMDKQLGAYQKVDWQRLYEENPDAYNNHWRQYTLLKDQRGEVVEKIRQKDEQRAVETQQATAKRYDEARTVLSQKVPDWGPELVGKIEAYGATQGYTTRELLDRAADPRDVIALNKARLYDELIAKQKSASKPLPTRQDAPVTQVTTGRAPARVDPDKLPMDKWVELERKRLAKKAAAR